MKSNIRVKYESGSLEKTIAIDQLLIKERAFIRRLCLNTVWENDIRYSIPFDLNWSWIMNYTSHHGLAPLFWKGLGKLDKRFRKVIPHDDFSFLSELGLGVSPDLVKFLQKIYLSTLNRNLVLGSVLDELDEALRQKDLNCIVWKGGALAFDVYPYPGLRPMDDIDLVVPPDRLREFKDVLSSMGFEHRKNFPLVWNRKDVVLDLHHDIVHSDRISQRLRALPMKYEALAPKAQPMLRYGNIKTLSSQDTLISNAVHSMKHGYGREIWLVDSFCIYNRYPELWDDPEVVLSRAREFNAITPLSILVSIMGSWQGFPDTILSSEIRNLNQGFISRMFIKSVEKGDPIPYAGDLLFSMCMQETASKIMYYYEIVFPSRKVMEQIFNIRNPRFYRVYYLVRCLSILKKGFKLITMLLFTGRRDAGPFKQ
ncbi:nucleotidyltransferase family protein [Thermodesulfobacteriota bacterium]